MQNSSETSESNNFVTANQNRKTWSNLPYSTWWKLLIQSSLIHIRIIFEMQRNVRWFYSKCRI